MKRAFRWLFACQLLCAAPAVFAEDALQQLIQAKENQWAEAYNANDLDRVTAFYEADAVLIAPGALPAKGRAAIGDAFRPFFQTLRKVVLFTDQVKPLGSDYLIEIGHSTYEGRGDAGAWAPGSDNYQVVWHKGPDGWHYVTDMFNARPADAATAKSAE